MSLTPNEISDLNDLLIKLSLSEPMPGIVYDSIMYDDDEELDIQTQPLHDDGQPREAITALTCPTPRIPGLTLSSPLLNLPDLDLDGRFESQPEVQNMLLQLIEVCPLSINAHHLYRFICGSRAQTPHPLMNTCLSTYLPSY